MIQIAQAGGPDWAIAGYCAVVLMLALSCRHIVYRFTEDEKQRAASEARLLGPETARALRNGATLELGQHLTGDAQYKATLAKATLALGPADECFWAYGDTPEETYDNLEEKIQLAIQAHG